MYARVCVEIVLCSMYTSKRRSSRISILDGSGFCSQRDMALTLHLLILFRFAWRAHGRQEEVWANVTSQLDTELVEFEGLNEAVLEGGHGLRDFSLTLWMRSTKGCVEPGWYRTKRFTVRYEANAEWFVAGCSLMNGINSRFPPASWRDSWRRRRSCCPVDRDIDLNGQASLNRDARERVKRMLFGGSRSDFGLTLLPHGKGFAFGTGHRDFAHSGKLSPGRPVRDTTLEANVSSSTILDGQWHHVVAVRRSGKLELYFDSRRLFGTTRRNNQDESGASEEDYYHELHDSSHFVAVGQLFRGSMYDVALHRRAWSLEEISERFYEGIPTSNPTPLKARPTLLEAGRPRQDFSRENRRPIPLYYLAHSDNGSVAMRNSFLRSISDPPDAIEPREVTKAELTGSQSQRYGPKGELILKALTENPRDSVVLVSDLDIRYFKPIASIVDLYATMRPDADVVFQRDDDFTVNANLGFMAIRCREHVIEFFRQVADMATSYASGRRGGFKGGDQKIVNVALRNFERFPQLPRIRFALFPTELMTRSIDQQRGILYKHEANNVMYHVNDFGSAKISPAKARETKVALLDAAENRHRLLCAGDT